MLIPPKKLITSAHLDKQYVGAYLQPFSCITNGCKIQTFWGYSFYRPHNMKFHYKKISHWGSPQ